jgi:N-acetylglutamate synthase-like GNAT family acetyltransferase
MYIMRESMEEDQEALNSFLGQDKCLPVASFFIVCDDEKIVGAIGYERKEKDCLLKNFVFSATVDKMVFVKFFSFVLTWLRQKEIDCVYLVTKGSATIHFFEEFGFMSITDSNLPKLIQEMEHYQAAKQQKNSVLLACNLYTNISTV